MTACNKRLTGRYRLSVSHVHGQNGIAGCAVLAMIGILPLVAGPACIESDTLSQQVLGLPPFQPADATHNNDGLQTAVGLSPRVHTAAGYIEALTRTLQVADVAVVQCTFAWDFLRGRTDGATYREKYDWIMADEGSDGRNIFQQHGLGSGFWLSFTDPIDTSKIADVDSPIPIRFSDPDVSAAFVSECVWFATHFRPDYLALGVEIDSFLEASSTNERQAFLETFTSAYTACKETCPECVIFVYFQYENVLSRDLWSLIEPFATASDVFAFSSYPSLPVSGTDTGWTSDTISESYFDDIPVRLGSDRPLAIVEFGHPMTSSVHFINGSVPEQATMVERLFRNLDGLDVALVTWTYLHDPDLSSVYDQATSQYFGSMGLLRCDQDEVGGPTWEAFFNR